MEGLKWCRDKVAPRGSDLAIILAFSEPESEQRIVAFQALRDELTQIPERVSDPDVARAKIAWWRSAIAQFSGGEAEHPILKALLPWKDVFASLGDTIDQWLAAIMYAVDVPTLSDWQDVETFLAGLAEPALELESALFSAEVSPPERSAIAVAEALTRALIRIGRGEESATALMPYAELAELGLTRGDLLRQASGPEIEQLFDRQRERVVSRLKAGRAGTDPVTQDRLRHLFLRMALDAQLMQVLGRKGSSALARSPSVSGQRKLWRVWRDARRLRRQAMSAKS